MRNKNWKTVGLLIIAVLVFSSCAHQGNLEPCMDDGLYGFWSGLWHGMIALFSFIGSWFDRDIFIYSAENNGFWYNLGFLFGVGGLFGGGTTVLKK